VLPNAALATVLRKLLP